MLTGKCLAAGKHFPKNVPREAYFIQFLTTLRWFEYEVAEVV